MASPQSRAHPADLIKQLVEEIDAEHGRLIECYSRIAALGEQIAKLSGDNARRLIGHG